ncbi:hypothetical protein C8A03DRAFT_48446 [Achaetomium macrosporum]|uniref:HNH nuclease domain-containing protein n=1 Tax=Achaetomium macrosporum TaxID=79813 RepID=A0AAN7H8U0_9PEZI|nr:hypothetical protein C8A03DRAFT_48446 [Achaetomium macrosporum]
MEADNTLRALVDGYLGAAANDARKRDALRRFLATEPETETRSNLLPIDEIEKRLEFVRQIEAMWKGNFEAWTHRTLSEFRPLADIEHLIEDLLKIPCLAKMFLAKHPASQDRAAADMASSTRGQHSPNPSGLLDTRGSDDTPLDPKGDTLRKKPQAERRELDNFRCVLSNMGRPEVCHIVPFSANAKEDDRRRLALLLDGTGMFYPAGNAVQKSGQIRELFTSGRGVSEQKWNMISLTPTLHDWWGQPYFALTCLGAMTLSADPDEIIKLKLQFHWMVWRERARGKAPEKPLGRSKEEFLAAFTGGCGDPTLPEYHPFAWSRTSDWPIKTGDIFYVRIQKKHAAKMMLAFELRWGLCKIIAMAGGDEVLADVGEDPDFLNERGRLPGLEAEFEATYNLHQAIVEAEASSPGNLV